jgi:Tol biopolymer transport system component
MISHVINEKDDLVCVKMVSESYMGGAHGSLNLSYMTFDTTTGSYVNLFDRVENKELFVTLAEQKFRKKRNLAPEDDLEKAGYWFPDNKFRLPANIGMDSNGYLLHYNPYEVAPYSSGPTDIVISFDELKKE